MSIFRKKGISLLVPTQNAEQTVEPCIRSFVDFPDEMIVVDNGSTDRTIEIVRRLEAEIPNLKFYDAPDLPDLHHNRQYALERSSYDWVVRIDSDYIAYTEGPRDIKKLREKILNTKRTFPPVAYGITQVNLFKDYKHRHLRKLPDGSIDPDTPPTNYLPARIVQHYPGMRFVRRGRWEAVRWQRYLNHQRLEEPYWFHCTFKSDMAEFYRSERTNWREHGDFERYPTLGDYVVDVIQEKYGTADMEVACRKYIDAYVEPRLIPYKEEELYPYPQVLLDYFAGAKEGE